MHLARCYDMPSNRCTGRRARGIVPSGCSTECIVKLIIVLAMHGSPPKDFPRAELMEFFTLHASSGHAAKADSEACGNRYADLEAMMRAWPRTGLNDPFYAASQELAAHLSQATGHEVLIGFHEFCAPTLDQALDMAVATSPDRVIVVTPMTTRGGEHSEIDIPSAVERARQRHPDSPIVYAWPFHPADVARFLASHISAFY